MTDILVLLLGLVCAGGGGELFVRGTVGIARAARVSPGIVAATFAAFATSSPETTVAVGSALAGAPEVAFGDAVGSNVVNVALILALAVLIAPLAVPRRSLRRDMPVALAVPVALAALLVDGSLSRLDGALLLAAFGLWLAAVVREARRERDTEPEASGEAKPYRAVAESLAGLVLLIAAGGLIVTGATGIAHRFGLSEFVIGATVVAVGTSAPELATAVIARLRGEDEVGLGTVLGSNIFNGLFVVGVAAVLHPVHVGLREAAPALVLGALALLVCYPSSGAVLARWRGAVLLVVYGLHVWSTL